MLQNQKSICQRGAQRIFCIRCPTSKENSAKLLVSFLRPWAHKEAMGKYYMYFLDPCRCMYTCVCVCVHIYSSVWYVNVCIIISMCMCEILIKDHVYSTLYSMHTLSCICVVS